MATNTLTDRSSGQTILDTFFNDIHSALNGDFVGRNSSGVATLGQNLGTNALPWGTIYSDSLVLDGSAVDTSLLTAPKNRIVSGKTRTTSNQPNFITPNGAAASFELKGASTNLVLDINGSTVQVTTDITKSSLTVGPSTTETALVDDADAADQDETKTWGEYGSEKETITVDNMGAEFQAFIGQWVIVKIAGVATEYALVYVKSATQLTNCYRGFFTNSSDAPVNRTAFTNNDTITVLSTGWVFVENDGATVDVSYTTPIRSFSAPSGPATGDYWYDLDNQTWKRYDGASWQIINRTLVGVVGVDSANCVAARSFDFYAEFSYLNNVELEVNSTEIIQNKNQDSKINVLGNSLFFGFNQQKWNITTDLAGSADMYNASEQSSTDYFLYVDDTGEAIVSDISPQFRPELLGYYHPHNPWRCVGVCFNDSSNNLIIASEIPYNSEVEEKTIFIKDVKANNTSGGTFTSGAWQTRDLNTVEGGSEFLSLSTNQFTITKGKYLIQATAPALQVASHKAKLTNITDSSDAIVGSSEYSETTDAVPSRSSVVGVVNFDKTKTFEIQHRCTTTKTTEGFGFRSNFSVNEVYTEVTLTKIG